MSEPSCPACERLESRCACNPDDLRRIFREYRDAVRAEDRERIESGLRASEYAGRLRKLIEDHNAECLGACEAGTRPGCYPDLACPSCPKDWIIATAGVFP